MVSARARRAARRPRVAPITSVSRGALWVGRYANVTTVTCLSNPWDWSYTGFDGNARSAYEQPVELYVENWGDAEVAGGVLWSYADLYVEALSWPRRG